MRIVLAGLILIMFVAVAGAEEPLETARRLREEANADHGAGRHEAAVTKFREADRIFAEAGERYLGDRASLQCAICWNLTKAGKHEESRAAWFRLAEMAAGNAALAPDVFSGYVAVATASEAQADLEAQLAFLEPVREGAVRIGDGKIAAQVLHDMAFYLAGKKEFARAVPLLEKAIVERRKIRDETGVAWSLNNLANALLELDRLEKALPRIVEAFALVHERDVREPQLNVAVRVRTALVRIAEAGNLTPKMKKFLWDVAFLSAEAGPTGDRFIPADYLLRVALAADPAAKMIGRVGKLALSGSPDEVRADVRLACARAYLAADKASSAARLLKRLPVGEGPAAAHLSARLATVNALVAAAGKKKKPFREIATVAADAWRDLGDIQGRKDALADLVAAVRTLEMEGGGGPGRSRSGARAARPRGHARREGRHGHGPGGSLRDRPGRRPGPAVRDSHGGREHRPHRSPGEGVPHREDRVESALPGAQRSHGVVLRRIREDRGTLLRWCVRCGGRVGSDLPGRIRRVPAGPEGRPARDSEERGVPVRVVRSGRPEQGEPR